MSKLEIYTYGGLVPVFAVAVLTVLGFDDWPIAIWLFDYTALICVFLSGMHWHIGIAQQSDEVLGLSIVEMLAVCLVFLWWQHLGLGFFAWLSWVIALLLILAMDHRLAQRQWHSRRFFLLRCRVTFLYILCLLAMVFTT